MAGSIDIKDAEGDNIGIYSVNAITNVASVSLDLPVIGYQNGLTSENAVQEEEFVMDFTNGWNLISFPFDLSTISKIEYENDNGDILIQNNPTKVTSYYYYLANGLYATKNAPTQSLIDQGYEVDEHESIDIADLFEGPNSDNKITIAKDSIGSIYWPSFNFNYLAAIHRYEAFQIHTTSAFTIKITAKRNHKYVGGDLMYGSEVRVGSGWSLMAWPVKHPLGVEELFAEVVSQIEVVKSNIGTAYYPEWNFNGIGDLIPGQGYQVKVIDGAGIVLFIAENE